MSTNIATPALCRLLIEQTEIDLWKLGAEPPIDPDVAKYWYAHRASLLSQLAMFQHVLTTYDSSK